MLINTLRSEWIKLSTTKAFWWTSSLFVAMSVAFAALTVLSTKAVAGDVGVDASGLVNFEMATLAVGSISMTVIIIQATMIFTSEYRHGTAVVTFTATPNRVLVIIAKTLMYCLIAAILVFGTVLACCYVSVVAAGSGPVGSEAPNPFHDDSAVRAMWALPLFAVFVVMLTMGVSVLVRHTAGAVSIMLVWFLALETAVSLLPKFGAKVAAYLPFANFSAFYDKQEITASVLSSQQSLWLFIAWAVGIWAIGLIVSMKRDV